MNYIFIVFMAWLAFAVNAAAQFPASQAHSDFDTLVICTPQLKQTLNRWVEYRQSQGRKILLLESQRFAKDNHALIRQTVIAYPAIDHLVLVGDAGDWRVSPRELLPTDFVLATVNVNFGSEFDIATDNTYGDLNDDGVPELAVGRIAVGNSKELDQYIDRVIAYEGADVTNRNVQNKTTFDASWRRRINLVAGIGGFGKVTDALIENITRKIITDKIPGGFETSMTHGSWRSPYCPDPRNFSNTAVQRFNEGCMFWVYLGHGERQRVDKMRVPKEPNVTKRRYEILDSEAVKDLDCRHGSPIAIFLACYAGAIDSSQDCLAEQMMKQDAGPIAVIAGSRVTMPYAMSLLAMEMSDEYFDGHCATLGGLLMLAKQKMCHEANPTDLEANADPYRQMIQSMGQTLSPLPKMLNEEKKEHLHLINLLGDPLLRLQRPERVVVDSLKIKDDGLSRQRAISVSGAIPFAGNLVAELVYRRDRFRNRPKRRRKFDPAQTSLAAYQQQYEQAHDLVCSDLIAKVDAGKFNLTLDVPAGVRGDCRVRLMLSGEGAQSAGRFAIGSIDVDVPRIKPTGRQKKSAPLIGKN